MPNTPAEIGPGEFYPVVGVGPHPEPWPTGEQYDPELLANGDRRNVLDHYRYWKVSSIVEDLDAKRHGLQIAIENWQHDLNIGSIVRTANAFNVSGVHIVGKRDWNRRGAMVTDRYLTVHHHPTVSDFADWCKENSLPIIGIDNVDGSKRLEGAQLPEGLEERLDAVLSSYLRTLRSLYADFNAAGLAAEQSGLRAAVVANCVSLRREVRVILPGGEEQVGNAVDIDETGRIVVEVSGEKRAISAGDIVHLRHR